MQRLSNRLASNILDVCDNTTEELPKYWRMTVDKKFTKLTLHALDSKPKGANPLALKAKADYSLDIRLAENYADEDYRQAFNQVFENLLGWNLDADFVLDKVVSRKRFEDCILINLSK